jgi:cell division initiation protein
MDSSDNSLSAIDSIDTVAFKIGLRGYGVDEVDEFLERLSSEVRQMKDLVQQQRQQLRQAAERISQLDARGPSVTSATGPVSVTPSAPPIRTSGTQGAEQVTSMIALAQRFIEQAQQEAEAKAREFTVAAQERAREIVTEARSRAEDEVNRLNGLKQRLSEDVDTLTHQLQAEKTRISGVLAEFTRWVETALQAGTPRSSAPTSSAPSAPASPTPSAPTRPLETPPPAPPAGSSQPTIGQVLKFEQTSRDDRQ